MGTRVDARDQEYNWSSASIVRVHTRHKETIVTIRFDGWGKQYDETLKWNITNRERLAPLHSFSKCVKCLVNLLPKKRSTPKPTKEEELSNLGDHASTPRVYCNLWPCKVQFRMPHPIMHGGDDAQDCRDAQDDLMLEDNIFIQPYNIRELPRSVRNSLTENDGMWLKAKRLVPWKNDFTELGVLPPKFTETFHLAEMDETTPGVLLHDAIHRGSLLKNKYRVHSRRGSIIRDGALREEESNGVAEHCQEKVLEENDNDNIVVESKVPAQPAPTQQQPPPPPPKVETSATPESKAPSCIVM